MYACLLENKVHTKSKLRFEGRVRNSVPAFLPFDGRLTPYMYTCRLLEQFSSQAASGATFGV
jgi:hypothetical protein